MGSTPTNDGPTQPFVFFAAILVACCLLLAAGLLHGLLSWRIGLEILLAGGAIYVLWVLWKQPGLPATSWGKAQRRFRAAVRTHVITTVGPRPTDHKVATGDPVPLTDPDDVVTPEDQYWYIPVAFLCIILGLILAVVAIMNIWELGFDQISPWLAAGGAAAFGVLALMAISYAPPGPNWVQRIAGIDGRMLLAVVGLAIVAVGTLRYFDYGATGTPPSQWWLAVVALGLLVTLSGAGAPTESRRPPKAAEAVEHARRAAELAGQALAYRQKTELISDPSSAIDDDVAPPVMAERAAKTAEARAQAAGRLAADALELEEGVGSKVSQAKIDADAAAAWAREAQLAHVRAEEERRLAEEQRAQELRGIQE